MVNAEKVSRRNGLQLHSESSYKNNFGSGGNIFSHIKLDKILKAFKLTKKLPLFYRKILIKNAQNTIGDGNA
jgi:hypothetical protein